MRWNLWVDGNLWILKPLAVSEAGFSFSRRLIFFCFLVLIIVGFHSLKSGCPECI
jgi:hypothetical protein